MSLFSLGFAVCELRKALIYKDLRRAFKTPKAGVAGSIPAGRTNKFFRIMGLRPSSLYRAVQILSLSTRQVSDSSPTISAVAPDRE